MSQKTTLLMTVCFSVFFSAGLSRVARADSVKRAPLIEVKKKHAADEDEDDGGDDGGSHRSRRSGASRASHRSGSPIWFAYWFPDTGMKQILEEKKWLLTIVTALLFPFGAALWAPL